MLPLLPLQLIPRPPWQVEPLLPDLSGVIRAAYLSGARDGFLAAVALLTVAYLLIKEFKKR